MLFVSRMLLSAGRGGGNGGETSPCRHHFCPACSLFFRVAPACTLRQKNHCKGLYSVSCFFLSRTPGFLPSMLSVLGPPFSLFFFDLLLVSRAPSFVCALVLLLAVGSGTMVVQGTVS